MKLKNLLTPMFLACALTSGVAHASLQFSQDGTVAVYHGCDEVTMTQFQKEPQFHRHGFTVTVDFNQTFKYGDGTVIKGAGLKVEYPGVEPDYGFIADHKTELGVISYGPFRNGYVTFIPIGDTVIFSFTKAIPGKPHNTPVNFSALACKK